MGSGLAAQESVSIRRDSPPQEFSLDALSSIERALWRYAHHRASLGSPALIFASLPEWLSLSSDRLRMVDCTSIALRPWYTAFSPYAIAWFQELKAVLGSGMISRRDIKSDIRNGLVRPSLLFQVDHGIADSFRLPPSVLRLDGDFQPPELKVPADRLKILNQKNRRLKMTFFFQRIEAAAKAQLPGLMKKVLKRGLGHPWMGYLKNLRDSMGLRKSRRRGGEGVSRHRVRIGFDWAFILPRKTQDRRLEMHCCEIARYLGGRYCVQYAANSKRLPVSKVYLFPEALLFTECLKNNTSLWDSPAVVFYTRIAKHRAREEGILYEALRRHDGRILCRSRLSRNRLTERGISPDRISLWPGAADPDVFQPHRRGKGTIGLTAETYREHCVESLIPLVRSLGHRTFMLLETKIPVKKHTENPWKKNDPYRELLSLPNVRLIRAPYEEFPRYYEQMDVFLSLSVFEDPTSSLIEAMMSNAVPLASQNGFFPDVIRHGENGFLYDLNAPVSELAALVEKALGCPGDIRDSVREFTWENTASKIREILKTEVRN